MLKKIFILLITVILIGTNITLIVPANNDNLLTNPGFESGLLGWHFTDDYCTWSSSTEYHTGLYSAKAVEQFNWNLGRLYQDFTGKLVPGTQYKIGGWMKMQDVEGGGAAGFGLEYVTSGGWTPADGHVMALMFSHNGTTDWEYFESGWFTLPEKPADCEMLWFTLDLGDSYGTAYWDDLFLYGELKEIKMIGFPKEEYECPPGIFHLKDGDINNDGTSDWYYECQEDNFGNTVELYGVDEPGVGIYFAVVFNSLYLIGKCPFEGGRNGGSIRYIEDENGEPYEFIEVFWSSKDEGKIDDIDDDPIWNGFTAVEGKDVITFTYFVQENLLEVVHYYENGDIVKSETGLPEWGSWLWNGELVPDRSIPVGSMMTTYNSLNVDINPNTINSNSSGKWVTCYIELPENYDVTDIDIGTLTLNNLISAETQPMNINDYDDDGILDLMVKFDRQDVIDILDFGDYVEIKISGELSDGTKFEGFDYIRVI